jgi:hypothetical protein
MIKVMLFVSRKDGLSRQEFREYYETGHAVLAASKMDKCVKYVRNFVDEEITGPIGFDVVTEFWFDVEGSWAEGIVGMTDDATRLVLEADEAKFMDRASMRVITVYEHESDPSALLGNGGRSASG